MLFKKINISESKYKINDMNTAIFANQLLFISRCQKYHGVVLQQRFWVLGASSAVNVGVVRNV